MKVYSIDSDGYITDIKNVGANCEIKGGDFKREPPFANNHHNITGLERPKSQEQINSERISELRQLIPDMQLLGDDVTELQAEFRTLLGL